MARRSVSRGRFPVRQPRSTEWVASVDRTALVTLAAGTASLDQSFNIAEPSTVVRVRGELWIASDQASANEGPFGALGFAIVSDQASAIGVTAVPTPIADQSSDLFFVHQPFQGFFATGQGKTWQRHTFDSRAMRKVNEAETVVVVIENAEATFGLDYILIFRMLVKLHG